MIRQDLLLNLLDAYTRGDHQRCKRIICCMSADETEKNTKLAEKLERYKDKLNNKHVFCEIPSCDLYHIIEPKRDINSLLLDDIVKSCCEDIIREHKFIDLLYDNGLEPRNKILFFGQSGNGKTSLAESIAYHIGFPLVIIRYENVIGSYLGQTGSKLTEIFGEIENHKCVLFLDEFDSIAKERGYAQDHADSEMGRVVNSLLINIDKLSPSTILVAASNHHDLFDKALWRRFQTILELKCPTVDQIRDWLFGLEHFLGDTVNVDQLSCFLNGYSFAELEQFCFDVKRMSVLNKDIMSNNEIIEYIMMQWGNRRRLNE